MSEALTFEPGRACAEALDAADPLAAFRDEFSIPPPKNGRDCVYLCGNSLGLQPKRARRYVEEELDDWAVLGVDGHLHAKRPWLPYHRFATGGLAELTGSQPAEVVAMNTLTVNLHVMMTTFFRPEPAKGRRKIVIESTAFPSDRFAAVSQLRLHGLDPGEDLLEWSPREPDGPLEIGDLEALLEQHGREVALMLLPGVQYLNGQVLPMQALCALARRAGCRIGLDLAHAIGNVELRLHDWGPDFAAWCHYKYLNGGPGAVAGAFVHERHLGGDGSNALLGWWGHEERTRFRMAPTFIPAEGAELWQLSNPPILSLAPVVASLEIFGEAGMARLREKSRALTSYTAWLIEETFGDRIVSITPETERGCQLSLVVRDGRRSPREVFDRLQELNVVTDWREPNVIRAAPVPLYNRFTDAYDFVARLGKAVGD
ncbi:MAG: kynureninase [Woeseiaceae bacterium]|nr:kynureninase [Woeseiaceae bacterium]